MAALTWDDTGQRTYETGVYRGVLYTPDELGVYSNGFAWNGLINIAEAPSGGEATPVYADNIKYLNILSDEQFNATLDAYTYPDEFAPYDGVYEPTDGLLIAQQPRDAFGLSYCTLIGNDVEGTDYAYKLHLIWNATAAPSAKTYSTVNDSPEAITFSWAINTIPVVITTEILPTPAAPTASIAIISNKVDPAKLVTFEAIIYGDESTPPRLPTPNEVIEHFMGVAYP